MKQDKQKRNWIIDAMLFGGFLVALWLDLTGVAVHQWLGIAVGALGRVSPGRALELGGGSNEPALWPHQQTIPPVLRGRRRPGSRVRDHRRDRPGHLNLVRSDAGRATRLAQHPRAGLRRDAGPGGWQDRAPLALDRQHGPPAHLPGARARWPVGRGASRAGRDPTGTAGFRAADGRGGGGGPVGGGERAQRHCRRSSRGGLRNTKGGRRRGPGRRIVGKHSKFMYGALREAVLVPGTLSSVHGLE